MTRSTKKKACLGGLICCLAVSSAIGAAVMYRTNLTVDADARADLIETSGNISDFVVTDTKNEIAATFQFTRINDTECSVRITNKAVATKAVIPSIAEIDGVKYKVTELTANAFMSSTKLVRVSLPASIKKIGNMAFANCTNLERISLSNIEEIGTNAFYKCPNLQNLILPKSLHTVGSTILRTNDTQVYVRAEASGANWAENWNDGNANLNVLYGSDYIEPLELETIYGNVSRSAESDVVGYALSDGQPRTDNYYEEDDNGNIFIPSMYNGQYILSLKSSAFSFATFDQCIIEISSKELLISSNAFEFASGNSIVVNRAVKFENADGKEADNVFVGAEVKSVVLPESITGLACSLFAGCEYLTNVFFKEPSYYEFRDDALRIVENLSLETPEGIVHLPRNANFSSISECAFDTTPLIKEIHVYDNVKNVDSLAFSGLTPDQKVIIHNDNGNFTENWGIGWKDNVTVVYTSESLSIIFEPDGGDVTPAEKQIKKGEPVGELPVPVKPYNVFTGWFDKDGTQYGENDIYSGNGDLTLYARWEEYSYRISFDSNRPNSATTPVNGAMDKINLKYSQSAQLNANSFSIGGWHFTGWNTEKDGSGDSFANEATVNGLCEANNGTVILYAQWDINIFSFFYNKNQPDAASNAVLGNMLKSTHAHGTSSQLSENQFTLYGWHFTGWNTQPDGNGVSFTEKQSVTNLTLENQSVTQLYAQWEQNTYSYVYDANRPASVNDVTGSMATSVHTYESASTLFKNAYALKGWTFTGWNTQADGTGMNFTDGQNVTALYYPDNAEISLYAQWKANGYTVVYNANKPASSGVLTGNMIDTAHVYDTASQLSKNLYELSGWIFTGWNTKADGTGKYCANQAYVTDLTETDNETVTLYAQWKAQSYSIIYLGNQPNTYYNIEGKMQSSAHCYDDGSLLTPNAFILKGWHFDVWTTEPDGSGETYTDGQQINLLLEQDNGIVVLYAQWQIINYKIKYRLDGGENPNTVTEFTVDDEITLLNPIKPGHDGAWSISVIPRGTYDNIETVALYTPRDFYVNCYKYFGDTEYTRITLKRGEGCSLNSVEMENYYFGGWKYNDEYITKIKNINTDMDLYAVWIPVAGEIYFMSEYAVKLTVSSEISVIELPNTYFKNYRAEIVVTSNVKKLVIHSDVYMDYRLSITVETRTQALNLYLLNFRLLAYNNGAGIYAKNSSINLYGYNCEIHSFSGYNAISCSNLTICTPIYAEGGSGSSTAHGASSAVLADLVTINSTYVTLCGGNGYESGGASAVRGNVIFTKDIYKETAQLLNGEDDDG